MDDFLLSVSGFSLSLHHLTVLDASVEQLIIIAGELGCAHVSLFTHVPEQARGRYPQVTDVQLPLLRDLLAQTRVSLCNLEIFPLDGDGNLTRFVKALTIGAALGATRATAHVHDADHRVAVQRFAEFCDLASDFGIGAGLEFNKFSAVCDCSAAVAIVREAARPNGAVVLDMLHLFRSGGRPADIAEIGDIVNYAQVCDGPAHQPADGLWHEAIRERLAPGNGVFPLAETLAHLRAGTIIDVEVPQTAARKAGVGMTERARHAVAATRRLLDAVPLGRAAV